MRILGLSCDFHDAAAAVVVDGRVVAAAEEERFSRRKHDHALPSGAVRSCLATAGIDVGDLDVVVLHEKPLVVAGRVLAARQGRGPAAVPAFAREFPVLLRENLLISYRVERLLRRLGSTRPPRLVYGEHHLSHAAAAYYPSPFPSAAVLNVDGVGEWATATIGRGVGHRLELVEEMRYPHSLGLLYSLFTQWCGFQPNDGEYKLMGLAPFGEPSYADELAELVELRADGSIRVDLTRTGWWAGSTRSRRSLARLFGPPRREDEPIERRHADLARTVQEFTEEAVLRMARHARDLTDERTLCLGGGVALNCVANGALERARIFDDIWVQPAPGDAGSAIGAALWYWHEELGNGRSRPDRDQRDGMSGAALGPAFTDDEIGRWLSEVGIGSQLVDDGERAEIVARRLAEGAIVGWFQGRMEFGPRALGHRSILADPRSTTVHRELNERVKGRESFRPFAPAVMWEHAADWFDIDEPSPYMLFTHQVAEQQLVAVDQEPEGLMERARIPRSTIPACTHVDGSARVQTVDASTNPAFHALLDAFYATTGCPVLLNTSFNRAGEPIVCTPDDALRTARSAGLDLLVLGAHIIELDGRDPVSD